MESVDGGEGHGRGVVFGHTMVTRAPEDDTAKGPVLLYDGSCGLCAASVQFVLRHDRRGRLRFAPLDGPTARRLLAGHPELGEVDSVIWVGVAPGGTRAVARSTAALRVARYLGGWWHGLRLLWLIPRPVRDWAYDVVARHRHRLAGRAPRCLVPPPEARDRFLDQEGEAHAL